MSWYFWVWGASSCLALLLLAFLSLVGVIYLLEKRRETGDVQELNHQVNSLRNTLERRDYTIVCLKKELLEARKGANEFGKISP